MSSPNPDPPPVSTPNWVRCGRGAAQGVPAGCHGSRFTTELLGQFLTTMQHRLGHVWFGGAKFAGDAEFAGVAFSGAALFDGATFSRGAWFDKATFTRLDEFDKATFTESAKCCSERGGRPRRP